MRKDKVRAYELRRNGKSYSEIRAALRIPKSTLASWFKKEGWSKKIRARLGAKASFSFPAKTIAVARSNRIRWNAWRQAFRDQAEGEFPVRKARPLFLAGTMLYWGKGGKSPTSILKLADSDPVMVRTFFNFLKRELGVPPDTIGVYLVLYPDLSDDMMKSFWSKATGIPHSQFRRSVYIKSRRPSKRLSYGVCNIYVNNKGLKEKILTWIDLYQKLLV